VTGRDELDRRTDVVADHHPSVRQPLRRRRHHAPCAGSRHDQRPVPSPSTSATNRAPLHAAGTTPARETIRVGRRSHWTASSASVDAIVPSPIELSRRTSEPCASNGSPIGAPTRASPTLDLAAPTRRVAIWVERERVDDADVTADRSALGPDVAVETEPAHRRVAPGGVHLHGPVVPAEHHALGRQWLTTLTNHPRRPARICRSRGSSDPR
jgi:hypothetical protein